VSNLPFDAYDFFGYLASGLLLLVGLERAFGFPRVLGADFKVVDSAVLLLAVYVAGQLIAGPAKTVLEDLVIGRVLGRPNVNLLHARRRQGMWPVLFPGFYAPLPEEIRDRVLGRAKREGINGAGEALFLHVRYSAAILSDEKLMARLKGFLGQYGFARNLAFTSLLIAAVMPAKIWLAPPAPPGLAREALVTLGVGILLFYRFLKFYRQHSFELFNTYAGRP
jgi:hypothetical protein